MYRFKSIVVKIEYECISNPDGTLDPLKMERMAMILSNLHNSGKHLVIVSSGAIALGTLRLKTIKPPEGTIGQQALAAVGQAELIKIYQNYFEEFNQRIAQILLTVDVIDNEVRKQNTLNTFNTLFEMDIIPVINENDAVSTQDIELKNNYPLTKNVAYISGSNMIIIKGEENDNYYILMKGSYNAIKVTEDNLLAEVSRCLDEFDSNQASKLTYPAFFNEIIFQ